MSPKTSSEIARETLKQLALRRLPPIPENYQAIYDEVAGTAGVPPFPQAPLRAILRVLPGQTPTQIRLLEQLGAAINRKDWSLLQNVMIGYASLGLNQQGAAPPIELEPEPKPIILPDDLSELLERLIALVTDAVGIDDARIHEIAEQITRLLQAKAVPASTLVLLLHNFCYRLSFNVEEQEAIREGLLGLLRLIFENIAALSPHDEWLAGQVEALLAAATPPLTLRRLDNVQLRLKDVIFKQTEARARSDEAQEQMKELLAHFLDRLAKMTDSSDQYHNILERCSGQIGQATSLEDIAPVLEEAMAATRALALDSRLVHDELETLRDRTEEKHSEIMRLQAELDRASAQARHDPLTGALNRKGLDEVMEREVARARRQNTPLCMSLLDVDNFKSINDRLGHDTGDAALVHLAQVIQAALRPQDMLARYGGEEFVLLLPDTSVEQGIKIMTRLQRELTTRFFLHNNEKLLITFSAGVALLGAQESSADALRRADQGMYLAKRAGKNRVIAA